MRLLILLLVTVLTGCTAGPGAGTSSVSVVAHGAVARIPGSATLHRVTLRGVGRPGGPSAADLEVLRASAAAAGLTSPTSSLDSEVRFLAALFGSALRAPGGLSRTLVFADLRRPPTARQLRLVRLVPADVRVDWGLDLSDPALERLQAEATAALHGRTAELVSQLANETHAVQIHYRLRYGVHLDPAHVARLVAAAAGDGRALPVAVEVTDEARADAARGVRDGTGPSRSRSGRQVLLVAAHEPMTVAGTGIASRTGFTLRSDGCVALGNETVIAPVGSTIDADGLHMTVAGVGRFAIGDGEPVELGGEEFDAAAAAQLLPPMPAPCGSAPFLLLGR